MAQLMQIQLQRYDAQPWGFRLQGGKDFAAPLVVQKINSGSLAEQAGLLPGDAVIKINDVDVYNLRHKEAQDLVVRSGNNFIVTVQRGGLTWRPAVTPTGQMPSPNSHSPYPQTVTKTSLAHKQQEVHHIGSGYNNSARPFNSVNGNDGQVKSIVNKQYNTPVGIYSDETIAETLSAQAEVLAGGVLGINFKKNEKQYQGDKSEVLKFLQEEETGEHHEPEPRSPANFYWTHSHAIGGQRPRSRPMTPSSKPHDERIGTPLQQNTLAPSASHRPSLPSHHPESRRRDGAEEEEKPTSPTPSVDPRLIIVPVCPALQSPEYKAELEAAAAAAGIAPREQKPLTNLPQCSICGVGIVGVFVRIKDKNLHVECFKCATCGTSLKNQGYYNFNNKLYCDIHARLAASQNPPSGTEGYVPVPIKPNTKLSASTISAALNNIGYNGSPTNGTTTPLYSAPPSNIESTNISDLPLPPPPSPTQLQQFQIQDAFCNGNLLTSTNNNNNNNSTINNHSRTNSSLSTASSSSLSLSPYSSTNGINNNSSCSPINNANIENSLNNHIGNGNTANSNSYNSTSTLSLDRFASSSSSPGHSRQQSTSSSTGSGITATDFQLPPPPPPPLPQQQQKYHQFNQIQQQQQQQHPNSMTINQSGKQNENDMNSNNRYASSGGNNPSNGGASVQANGVSGQGSAPSGGRADDSINSRTGQDGDQFQYVTLHGNVIRSVIPPGKGVSVNYKVNQGFARPYGAPAPAAAPKSPTSYPPPSAANNNWGQPRPAQQQQQQQQQQPANNMYATLPRSNAGPQGPAGFKPPQAQAQAPQSQQKQQQLGPTNIPSLNVSDSQNSSFAPPPSAPSTAPGTGPSNVGGKGKAFGATSAPKRGRGVLNKAVESGVRVPLCSSCNMQIRGPFITALGRIWCPDHFMCVNGNCRRPLQDVGFVEEKGDLYCEYCFEKYLAPTCSKCNGKIKGDCLNAIGRHFHPECFTCAHCGKLFGNTPFFLEEGLAYCEADWNELFTTKCFACGFPVEAGDRWVEALGNNYHSQCFNCTYCKKNLEGQSFYNKGGRPFCKNHAR
ncbi:PDZ and LIM domain protein Zasp isoform X4 [Eupeodes corollae]|uniref:PDZ and LIM domain protein Zasp isoform X4 n=1 Tax=Eupeodes corollae TaxID=290404 RepID=UPI0024932A75|nr:PDZ and LIM domain protein Zasp isoform X4 [Eupeodes corollae]